MYIDSSIRWNDEEPMKIIVTHLNPDQDAVASVWLVKRFFPGWADASFKFVPAGETLGQKPPDENPDIIHVDTGLGKFDHHTTGDRKKCAASLVAAFIKKEGFVKDTLSIDALERMIAVVLDVDHAGDKVWPDPAHDRYEFFFEQILDGLKLGEEKYDSERVTRFGLTACDGIFREMKNKVSAEAILEKGIKFESPWGKGIGVETSNDGTLRLAERLGYMIAVKKDPRKGNARIYAHPKSGADLSKASEAIGGKDPQSDWFLHASKRLLLNGSSSNPKMRPTRLTLEEIIKVLSK